MLVQSFSNITMKLKLTNLLIAGLAIATVAIAPACTSDSDTATEPAEGDPAAESVDEAVDEDGGEGADTTAEGTEEEMTPEQMKELRAKTEIGSLGRAQQAFFLENSSFAGTIEELELGLSEETDSYKYSVEAEDGKVTTFAQAKTEDLLSFKSVVVVDENNNALTPPVICATSEPGMEAAEADRDPENLEEPCE